MITLKVVTPEGPRYESDGIVAITIPTTSGVIMVKQDHVPLLSVLSTGELVIEKENGAITALAVSSGMLHVIHDNEVHVLADTAERAEDIDLERAEAARKRAEEYLKQKDSDENIDYALLQAKIEKELARISVARKYKKLKVKN